VRLNGYSITIGADRISASAMPPPRKLTAK